MMKALVLVAMLGMMSVAAAPPDDQLSIKNGVVEFPTLSDDKPRDFSGLHNVVAFSKGYLSGSVPEGDAGFEADGVEALVVLEEHFAAVDRGHDAE